MTQPRRADARLIDFLRDWRVARLGISATNAPLIPTHIRKASAEVVRQLGDLTPRTPKPFELQQIDVAIRQVWQGLASLAQVPARILRLAPWVFFFPRNEPNKWLAGDQRFVEAWLAWLRESGRPRAVVTLLREFLSVYPRENPSFDAIRESLRQQLAAGRGPRIEKWRERAGRFGLLEGEAPALLMKSWWDVGASFEAYATEAGLLPGLEFSGLVKCASEHLLGFTEEMLTLAKPRLDFVKRSLEWLESDEQKLRFSELRIPTAKALLSPFRDRNPDAALQEVLQGFLLRTIGDPRSQRPKWQGIPEDVRNVLFRWLVSASLEDFFRVLDETAQDSHWKFRKAFWSAYLRREAITDAWVVLGPAAAAIVRKEFDAPAGAAKLKMGEGAQSSHSVLLMRVGTVTIAEWSHNGKCRIWKQGNPKAPKLYETEYRRGQLVDRCNWDKAHMGSEDGRWQADIARRIADETGIRVARSEYMPERKR